MGQCQLCLVCLQRNDHLLGLTCGHLFCRDCWQTYFCMQIQAGMSTGKFVNILQDLKLCI